MTEKASKSCSFEEILLFLQWLSNLCVNLSLLNVDKQTANAELKAEKSNNFLGNKRAMGGKRVKTYKRRLSDAVFGTNWNLATSQYLSLEYGQR